MGIPHDQVHPDTLQAIADDLAEHRDRYGRYWILPADEICAECGQPDNCGDCNHEPLTVEQVLQLGGALGLDTELWEVLDSYGVPVYMGTLVECGTWIDPVLSIVFNAENNPYWPGMDDVDQDRVHLNDDGSYTVDMYEAAGGIGGQLTVRKVTT